MSEDRGLFYAERLARMIACPTVSHKGTCDDAPFAALRQVMEELFPLVHERAEKRTFSEDCWIFRLPGRDKSRRIMLMSHHDVAEVDEARWTVPPFDGLIREGKLYGRGTVDTKTPLFAEFSALEELLAEGYEPPCDIYIGSSHNEEQGGDGIPAALQWFKEQGITFDLVLDEGGAVIDPPMSGMSVQKCAMVAIHEKGRCSLTLTAGGENAHAGLTAATLKNPAERMAALVTEIGSGKLFIRRLNPQVRAMFEAMAPYSGALGIVFKNLWLFGGLLQKLLPGLNPTAADLLGTTCTVTEITGDRKGCTAKASFRPVDKDDLQKDLRSLTDAAAKLGIEVTVDPSSEYHDPARTDTPMFPLVADTIRQIFPDAPPVPFILPAGTDARWLTDICPAVLRFAPIRLSKQQLASVHSEDENIDLTAITDAVRFYKTLLQRL